MSHQRLVQRLAAMLNKYPFEQNVNLRDCLVCLEGVSSTVWEVTLYRKGDGPLPEASARLKVYPGTYDTQVWLAPTRYLIHPSDVLLGGDYTVQRPGLLRVRYEFSAMATREGSRYYLKNIKADHLDMVLTGLRQHLASELPGTGTCG